MSNTWPGGKRRALSQSDHEKWNANNYPGTLQICVECDEPTGFCEDDGLWNDDGEPLCIDCSKRLEGKDVNKSKKKRDRFEHG